MADDAVMTSCPWCSEPLPTRGAADCPRCGAHLLEDPTVEVPGVTSVDPGLLRAAAAPRKVKRTFGSLLVGDDDEIPPPTEAEMPAIARPDAAVRREMLRLEMEARLAALQADARMLEAEDRVTAPTAAELPDPAEPAEPPELRDPDEPPELPDPAELPEPAEDAPAS